MQLNPFEQPLEIPVTTSVWWVVALYVIHAGACLSVLVSALPVFLRFLFVVGVLVSLWHVRRQYISQQNPDGIVSVLLNIRDEWWLTTRAGLKVQAALLPGIFVHPQLIILTFRTDKQYRRIFLTPDQANQNDHRRLRVKLRYQLIE